VIAIGLSNFLEDPDLVRHLLILQSRFLLFFLISLVEKSLQHEFYLARVS